MKRTVVVAIAALAMALSACQNKQQQTEARVEGPYVPLEQIDASSGDRYVADETVPEAARWDTPAATEQQSIAEDEILTPAGARTYVVQKGDTLYGLARQFYSDQSRWRDIWEANRNRVPDKNVLPVGTRLIIP